MMNTSFTDKTGRVACPASLEHGDLVNSGEIHFASRSQIEKYGLCRKCRKRMKEHGKGILRGKIEQPAAIEKHHFPTVEQDHAAFDASGEIVQTVDFDYAEIDAALGLVKEAPPDARRQAGELVREIFVFCFGLKRKEFTGEFLKLAALRFAVVVSGMRPDVLNDSTHGELARLLGRTKACASKNAVIFQDRNGFKFARSRSVESRQRMAQAALGHAGRDTRKRNPSNQGVTKQGEPGAMPAMPPPAVKENCYPQPLSHSDGTGNLLHA